MRLFKLTTAAGWIFYVVSDNVTNARIIVEGSLTNYKSIMGNGYGFSEERKVVMIETIAIMYDGIETRYIPQLMIVPEEEK